MGEEPQSGALFVFLGKSPTRIKILWFDRNGYCLLGKRLHRAIFILPKLEEAKGTALRIETDALAQLLAGALTCAGRENRVLKERARRWRRRSKAE